MAANPFDNYLDLVEAARILRIHPQSLRRLIKQKKVPAILFAGKIQLDGAGELDVVHRDCVVPETVPHALAQPQAPQHQPGAEQQKRDTAQGLRNRHGRRA